MPGLWHQTWINLEFAFVDIIGYSLKQLTGTNKALRIHEGKLQCI